MITESRVRVGGGRTRVLAVAGTGVPIVFLHGYGDCADTWRGVLTAFAAAGRTAMAFDLPGFGHASKRGNGPLVPQFDQFVDAIIAEDGPVILAGNSLGSATAVRAAARHHQHIVPALIAIDDPINVDHRLARLVRRSQQRTLFTILAHLRLPARLWHPGLGAGFGYLLYGPTYQRDPEVIERWVTSVPTMAALSALGRDAVRYAHETTGGHQGLHIDCPTLIVHGAKDRIIPVAASRLLHAALPHSELVVLGQSGHCPQLDDPDRTAALILDFLVRAEQQST